MPFGRILEEAVQRAPETRRRLERHQAQRVHEHQPVEPIAVIGGEASRDGAAEPVPDQNRR